MGQGRLGNGASRLRALMCRPQAALTKVGFVVKSRPVQLYVLWAADRRSSALRRRVADTLARAGDADRADRWAAGERADCGPAAGLRRWFRRCPSPRTIAMEWRQQHDGEGATRCCRSSSWPRRRRSSASTSISTAAKNRTYSLVLLVESGMVFCGPTRSARHARRRERRAARVFRVWASELEAFKFTLCCFR